MKRGGLWLIVAALVGALFYGVAGLYRLRVARGDVFPEYSSLRADPMGTRALHDAAGLLSDRENVRWLRPLERLQAGAGDAVFVVGMSGSWLGGTGDDGWLALDRAAVAGAHVVVGWRADRARPGDAKRTAEVRANPWQVVPKDNPKEETPADSKKEKTSKKTGSGKTGTKEDKEKESNIASESDISVGAAEHERRWGFRLLRRELLMRSGEADAVRGAAASAEWPETLSRWQSDLFFLPKESDGWQVLYRRGAEPVMIRRARGAGSVTLLADSFLVSNEAVQRDRATAVLAALLADARRVVFVESHLGVRIESGVAVLARRYGLGGAALTALVLAGLWIWRRMMPLAPVIAEDEEVRLALAPTAGLEALLRRAVSPAKLFAACLAAWRTNATAGDRQRMERLPEPATGADPVAAYNATTRTLSHKRIS